MNLLLDQGLPRTAAALLRTAGFGATHVGELGLHAADDGELLDFARQNGQVIVTLDADFHSLLAKAGATSPSVVRLRLQGLSAEKLAEILPRVLRLITQDLSAGAAATVDSRRIRVRRLPLRH